MGRISLLNQRVFDTRSYLKQIQDSGQSRSFISSCQSRTVRPHTKSDERTQSFSIPLDLSLKSNKFVLSSCNNPAEKCEKPRKAKKQKYRKPNFDEIKSCPISGIIIKDRSELEMQLVMENADIDPRYNVVEITDEAKAELAKIENKLGDYECKLCVTKFEDAFSLAQHRCSCIVHLEYKCSECDKIFNCPANLASHRRWHKPKSWLDFKKHLVGFNRSHESFCWPSEIVMRVTCPTCGQKFREYKDLRKHIGGHHTNTILEVATQNDLRYPFLFYPR